MNFARHKQNLRLFPWQKPEASKNRDYQVYLLNKLVLYIDAMPHTFVLETGPNYLSKSSNKHSTFVDLRFS